VVLLLGVYQYPRSIVARALLKPFIPMAVEHPLGHGQHHGAGAIHPGVGAQQGMGAQIPHLDALLEQAHQHLGANGRRTRRVAAVVDAHTAVVADRALHLGEVLHARGRQRLQVGAFLLEHGLHLAALGPMDTRGRPLRFPVLQESVLLLDGLKAPALQGRGLRVADQTKTPTV
jgi:hypothetical protein